MYAWLFRHLPGPLWVRILLTVVLVAAVVVALFGWGFPAIAPHLPFDGDVIGALEPGGGDAGRVSLRSSGV